MFKKNIYLRRTFKQNTFTMIVNKDTAKKTAELLLQINAIKLQPENPFTWTSGWKSPIYCDNRVLLSHPEARTYVKEQLAKHVKALYGKPDVIAGVATGAIGIGTLVADVLGLPFVYVRPEPKLHGRARQVEGHIAPNQSVVVIEELVSTGKSSLNAVKALRALKADVKGLLAIFSYRFPVAVDRFNEEKVPLNALLDYEHLIEKSVQTHYVDKSQLHTLSEWLANPSQWKQES